jgi:hypothetical protein
MIKWIDLLLYRQENAALFVGQFSLMLAFNLQIASEATVAGESSRTLLNNKGHKEKYTLSTL